MFRAARQKLNADRRLGKQPLSMKKLPLKSLVFGIDEEAGLL
jgi:hypothetical protein